MSKKTYLSVLLFALLCVTMFNIKTNPATGYTVGEDTYDMPSNNTFATAAEIWHGYFSELCQKDDDWYRFMVYSNQYVEISIKFDGAANDMNMQLFDYNQNYITFSDTAMNYEVISFQATMNNYYYIKVSGNNNYEAYNMSVYIYDYIINDDSYEENDAYFYNKYGLNTGQWYYNLYLYDQDCYAFDVEYNQEIEVQVSHAYMAQFSIYALTPYGMNVIGGSLDTSDPYLAEYTLETGTMYEGQLVFIITNMTFSGAWYDLKVEIEPIDDDYEDNEGWSQAYYGLNFDSWYFDLILNDADAFGFYAYSSDKFQVTINHDYAQDIWIFAYNQYGNSLGGYSDPDQYSTTCYVDVGGYSGNVIFVVEAMSYNGQYYDLYVDLNPTGGGGVSDSYEDNNYRDQAYELSQGSYSGIHINEFDSDWFKVYLDWGEYMHVKAYFDTNSFDLEMNLLSETNHLIDFSNYYSGYIEANLPLAPISGYYYISLYTWETNDVPYELQINIYTSTSKAPGNVEWVGVQVDERYEWQVDYKSSMDGMSVTQSVSQNHDASGTFSAYVEEIVTQEGVAVIRLEYENSDIFNSYGNMQSEIYIDAQGQPWNQILPDPFGTSFFVGIYFSFEDLPQLVDSPMGEISKGGKMIEYILDTSGVQFQYRVEYDENGVLIDYYFLYDDGSNYMELTISGEINPEDANNPFNIPGYPFAILLTLSTVGMAAIIIKRRK